MNKVTPKTANTNKKLCSLKRDNFSLKNSWILVTEGNVYIKNQISGSSSTGEVVLTKREFNRFIKFYETGK